jgi:hypothetical protein
VTAGIVPGIGADRRDDGRGIAARRGYRFIEETVLLGHNAYRQLPFPEGKRK